jgi:hypothetical protein
MRQGAQGGVRGVSQQVIGDSLSEVAVLRAYYYCAKCGAGVIPKDEELDINGHCSALAFGE